MESLMQTSKYPYMLVNKAGNFIAECSSVHEAEEIMKRVNNHDKLVEALNDALKYKGGWRECIAMLQDFTSNKVEVMNMLVALDQMDRWSRQAKEALKSAGELK